MTFEVARPKRTIGESIALIPKSSGIGPGKGLQDENVVRVRRRRWRITLALAFGALLAGCLDGVPFPSDVLTPEAERLTRAAALTVLSGDPERIRDALTTSGGPESLPGAMTEIRSALAEHVPAPVDGELTLVHAENRQAPSGSHPIYQASYEIVRPDDVLLVEVAVEDGGPEANGLSWLNLRSMDAPPSGANDFGTVPLTLARAAFVAAMVAVLAFIATTMIIIARDREQSRRWLWVAFAAFGTWGLVMNWTTGAVGPNFFSAGEGSFRFQPIKFVLFGGGFERAGLMAPWMLQVGLPLGAIVYWARRAARRHRAAAEGTGSSPRPDEP